LKLGEQLPDGVPPDPVEGRIGDALECEVEIAMTQIGVILSAGFRRRGVDAVVVGHRMHELQKDRL